MFLIFTDEKMSPYDVFLYLRFGEGRGIDSVVFVCSLTRYLKNHWMDSDEILKDIWSRNWHELITLRIDPVVDKSSGVFSRFILQGSLFAVDSFVRVFKFIWDILV